VIQETKKEQKIAERFVKEVAKKLPLGPFDLTIRGGGVVVGRKYQNIEHFPFYVVPCLVQIPFRRLLEDVKSESELRERYDEIVMDIPIDPLLLLRTTSRLYLAGDSSSFEHIFSVTSPSQVLFGPTLTIVEAKKFCGFL